MALIAMPEGDERSVRMTLRDCRAFGLRLAEGEAAEADRSGKVSVPVLSKTTVSTSASRSSASPDLQQPDF
jgi:hypothetical protein